MSLQKYIPSWLCGSNDCYPYPSSSDPQTGGYIPLTSQPPPPLPMRVLPLSLTSRDYRTAQEIHTFLLQAPRREPPDLTADITATFGLLPEAYTPRVAEYLVLALETTVEAAPMYDWYKARGKGIGDAYWAAKEAASDSLRGVWHVAEVEWDETGKYASKPAQIVKTLLALAILVRMAPGFTRVLGFQSGGGPEGENPVFVLVAYCCYLVTLASLSHWFLSLAFSLFVFLFDTW